MDLFLFALFVMFSFWSRSVLCPKPEPKKQTIEEELGEAVGKVLKEEDFGKTLGKYLKETAESKDPKKDSVVNVNIHLNAPPD